MLGSIVACQHPDSYQDQLKGKWELTNLVPADTTSNKGFAFLALTMAVQDVHYLEFTPDSQLKIKNRQDGVLATSPYQIRNNPDKLILGKNQGKKVASIIALSDHEMTLSSEDGTRLTLEKVD